MKKWQQKNRLTINGWTGCYQAVCVLHLFSMCQLLFFPPPPYLGFVQYLTEREKNDNKGSYCHLLVQLDSSWLHFSSSREGSLETKKTSNATVADAFSFFSSPCEFYSSSRVWPNLFLGLFWSQQNGVAAGCDGNVGNVRRPALPWRPDE